MDKERLLGKTLPELKAIVQELGLPTFSAKQICEWLYKKKVDSIEKMTNLSLVNREKLSAKYEVGIVSPERVDASVDGTRKYLFRANKGLVETVYIPEEDRATLCVSSQVGCKMNCLFCMTGKQGFSGHLSAADILNQMQAIPETDLLTNVVFMGMGEPMDNVDEVLKTLEIMTSDWGYAWSPKRITVSTVGIIPGMRRFLEESSCHLAVSLHNPISEERRSIMPIEKAFPIEKVIEEIKKYDFSHQRRVSFEYTMFSGVNDRPAHVKSLVSLLAGLECRINLIRFHAVPGVPLEGSSMETMEKFRDDLMHRGIMTTIRKSRGEDIFAACGLLSSNHTGALNEKAKVSSQKK
ncbi:MAG: 23S rRNA (adenine(2503)-C(2))-methyltransferase RlmN [Paludibacteraceae bacterium]|nr:23S rRNA (adenine(2503)-C(2))-methyltransferase RlmN [Paludibacteraceae bacterium]